MQAPAIFIAFVFPFWTGDSNLSRDLARKIEREPRGSGGAKSSAPIPIPRILSCANGWAAPNAMTPEPIKYLHAPKAHRDRRRDYGCARNPGRAPPRAPCKLEAAARVGRWRRPVPRLSAARRLRP